MTPEVSVIIPTYNRADTIQRAVRSALAQTYEGFELIVVDDGSDDATPSVIAGFQDHRIRYIRGDVRRGGGAARNAGIDNAKGRFIAFLDSDDEWFPEKLEKQVQLLQERPTVGAVYTGYVAIDEEGQTAVRLPKYRGDILDELLSGNRIGTASTVVVRRGCLERVGAFDAALASCQDWDLWIRLAQRYHFDFINEVLVTYFIGVRGRITSDTKAVADGHRRIAEKYFMASSGLRRRPGATQLFSLGRRLIGLGYRAGLSQSLRLGRRLILAAYRERPLAVHYLLHYGASYNGLTFRILGGLGWRAHAIFNVLARRPFPPQPSPDASAVTVLTQTIDH